jgi:hypothetical protein
VLLLPEGNAEAVITNAGGAMVSDVEVDLLCTELLLSETVAVKLKVPLTVGVPERRPVLAARLRPAGKLPEVIDHL